VFSKNNKPFVKVKRGEPRSTFSEDNKAINIKKAKVE
jgi:hypothetical protein